jgi:hypothetical protein
MPATRSATAKNPGLLVNERDFVEITIPIKTSNPQKEKHPFTVATTPSTNKTTKEVTMTPKTKPCKAVVPAKKSKFVGSATRIGAENRVHSNRTRRFGGVAKGDDDETPKGEVNDAVPELTKDPSISAPRPKQTAAPVAPLPPDDELCIIEDMDELAKQVGLYDSMREIENKVKDDKRPMRRVS